MKLRVSTVVLVVFVGLHVASGQSVERRQFNRDVRPILSDKCFQCHGPDSGKREADLRLDRESDAKADRDGHAAIVPNMPEASELIHRITTDDENERMPPEDSGKTLNEKQIALLKQWIAEGAEWSLAWSYMPPRRESTPTVEATTWPVNWIDHFVLKQLAAGKLKPSEDADKTTLIRRLYFDLVGLPPTPTQVDAFLADEQPNAYERVVDELLASPHFGERMAIYWLDLVRYADTVGYHGDQDQNIAPYRDYVINALNRNLPFDQFTREQLAGDLLPQPTLDQKVATGYNRLLQTSHEGGVQPKEYLSIYAADRVRNLSVVWLGATMGCAQCHDHKFDPYSMKDFYSMQAFFADIDEAQHFSQGTNSLPTARPPEMPVPSEEQKSQVASLETQLAELDGQLKELSKAPPPAVDPESSATAAGSETPSPEETARQATIKSLQDRIAEQQKQLAALQASIPKTMITVAIAPRTIRILPRGNWLDDSGEVVQPAVPEFLGKLDVGDRRATRLDLANWLTDTRQGIGELTARVMVNRFWYLLLGNGLASLDDFGGQGQAPTNPALLDALAVEFVENSWNIKQLVKRIVMSRTYRQSSLVTPALQERDPLNQWFARQSRYRFSAEVVRDSTLAISGLLVDKLGGASVKPYQPARYYRNLNFPEREYQSHTDERQWRRGVYVHWQRQFLHPMLKAFDAPAREECTAERPRSNTPLAALVLLNDPSFVEAARAFAARILQEGGSSADERIDFAFRHVVSHLPSAEDRTLVRELVEESQRHYGSEPEAADKLLAVGLAPIPKELNRMELAAWTMAARTMLAMQEAITRN